MYPGIAGIMGPNGGEPWIFVKDDGYIRDQRARIPQNTNFQLFPATFYGPCTLVFPAIMEVSPGSG